MLPSSVGSEFLTISVRAEVPCEMREESKESGDVGSETSSMTPGREESVDSWRLKSSCSVRSARFVSL